jgi:hypothetical protein
MTSSSLRTVSLSVMFVAAIGFLGSTAHAQTDGRDTYKWLDCSIDWLISGPYFAGPNFTARVLFHNTPVSSVRVLLARKDAQPDERDWKVVAASETNSHGIARLSAIPPGEYAVRIEEGLLTPAREEIEIDANSTAKTEITFQWPGESVAVRNLRGLLNASDASDEKPLPLQYVLVQLLDLRSTSLIASTNTDGEGHYEFPPFGDGLYVVRFNEDQYAASESHDMAVEVKSNTAGEIPTMKLVRKGCNPGLFRLDGKN